MSMHQYDENVLPSNYIEITYRNFFVRGPVQASVYYHCKSHPANHQVYFYCVTNQEDLERIIDSDYRTYLTTCNCSTNDFTNATSIYRKLMNKSSYTLIMTQQCAIITNNAYANHHNVFCIAKKNAYSSEFQINKIIGKSAKVIKEEEFMNELKNDSIIEMNFNCKLSRLFIDKIYSETNCRVELINLGGHKTIYRVIALTMTKSAVKRSY
jgi:hypothetical protein